MMEELKSEIAQRQKHHRDSQRRWSFFHHSTTFGAVTLSLAVAAIAPLPKWPEGSIRKDILIAVLSFIAAILAAISARGGFERKWVANRLTRSRLDILHLDTLDGTADPSAIKETLKRIVIDHDAAIVGAACPSDQKRD
jgi:hypothetical protein